MFFGIIKDDVGKVIRYWGIRFGVFIGIIAVMLILFSMFCTK